MTNLKRVFLMILVIVLLGVTIVYANDVINITENETTAGGDGNNIVTNTQNDINNESIVVGGGTQTSQNTNNNTANLPKTGTNDYAMVLVIGVFAISAVYAYKKVRDYKNI